MFLIYEIETGDVSAVHGNKHGLVVKNYSVWC